VEFLHVEDAALLWSMYETSITTCFKFAVDRAFSSSNAARRSGVPTPKSILHNVSSSLFHEPFNVPGLLQMSHLLGNLHVLGKQFGDFRVFDTFFGKARLERSAQVGCTDSRRGNDKGMGCSDWFLGCWLQFSTLLLQKR
jgi:hypothetical protein